MESQSTGFRLSRRVHAENHVNSCHQKIKKRRPPIPSFASLDAELERLETAFFRNSPSPKKQKRSKNAPIPNFPKNNEQEESDHTDDNLLGKAVNNSPLIGKASQTNPLARKTEPLSTIQPFVTETWQRAVRNIVDVSNLQSCTVKQVLDQLEETFQTKLDKQVRKQVKIFLFHYIAQKQTGDGSLGLDKDHPTSSSTKESIPATSESFHFPKMETTAKPILQVPSLDQAKQTSVLPLPPIQPLDIAQPSKPVERNDGPSNAVEPTKFKTRKRAKRTIHEPTNIPAPRSTLPKKSKQASSCPLCKNCPCTTMNQDSRDSNASFAQTDAAIEKALIKHLHRLEKNTERYAEQEDNVRRQLKKHRRIMWRKREEMLNLRAEQINSRFLPDPEEIEAMNKQRKNKQLSGKVVTKAQRTMFPCVPAYQPTLTQMFGESKEKALDLTNDMECAEEMENIGPEMNGRNGNQENCHVAPIRDEDTNGAIDENSCESFVDNDTETTGSTTLEQSSPIRVSRQVWDNGIEVNETNVPKQTLWGALMTSNTSCAWDRLFADPLQEDDIGLDELLGMFDDSRLEKDENSENNLQPSVAMSMLSQRSQNLANDLIFRIESNGKYKMLDDTFPNWRENILFALYQRESSDVQEALSELRATRERLVQANEAMIRAFDKQHMVLETFEDALCVSLNRLVSDNDELSASARVDSPCRHVDQSRKNDKMSPTNTCQIQSDTERPCTSSIVLDTEHDK